VSGVIVDAALFGDPPTFIDAIVATAVSNTIEYSDSASIFQNFHVYLLNFH